MAFFDYRPTTTLYHYCSGGSFEGITTNGSIWLSDLQYANDPKELQLAAIIDRVMTEMIRDATSFRDREAYARLKVELQKLKNRLWMHSFSVSTKPDQLPMWQEYTDRGRGFCIGFKPSAFDDMSVRVQKVRYVTPENLSALHSAIAVIAAPLVGHVNDHFKRIDCTTQLLSLITATKDHSWAHENEIRLIFSSMTRPSIDGRVNVPVGMLKDGTEIMPSDPLMRRRGEVDVPYFNMKFGRYRRGNWNPYGAIAEVIVGPNSSLTLDEVSANLRSKGYLGVAVRSSQCSFRP
ncbi:DUF2971 domain-containing protein [Rhizobium sp. ZK1]|uniref:DUF2971 domain-containing protein n=1 Tax=Rhizobium sp. ZK1 TaxID=3389872 RepID=UPI0039F6DAF1